MESSQHIVVLVFSDILPAFLEPVVAPVSANIRLIESAFFSLTCLSSGVKMSISYKEDSC